MKGGFRTHLYLWLSLTVAACDKPVEATRPTGEEMPSARRTRPTEREPSGDTAELRRMRREALARADAIESAPERERSIAEVAWDALEIDPELAREAFAKLSPDSAERVRLIQHDAMRMAEENVDEALRWAASHGTEHERAAAFGHIALVLSATEPERAANLLSESGIEGHAFDVVVVQVLGRWAALSPADAAAWAVLFPAGKSREAGIGLVVSAWLEADAGEAFSWLGTVGDAAVRGETARAMAAALQRQPETVRDEWLDLAEPETRAAIRAQWPAAGAETGTKARPPAD